MFHKGRGGGGGVRRGKDKAGRGDRRERGGVLDRAGVRTGGGQGVAVCRGRMYGGVRVN